jgi:cytochrome c-type biogenesis protein CcmH/NrfG
LARQKLEEGWFEVREPNQRAEELHLKQQRQREAQELRQTYSLIAQKRKELAAQPDSAKLHGELGDALERVGDLGSASVEFRLAVERDPQNPQFRNSLAWTLCLQGRYDDALPHAREADRQKPNDWAIKDTLAHAEFGTKNYDRAVAAWEAALTAKPQYMHDIQYIDCRNDKRHLESARSKVRESSKKPASTP